MSIFRESFRDYVKKQFRVRQRIISKGNSDIGSNSRLAGGNGLSPGAFYAYGEKQCVIRMSSLVDLMEDIGLDLGGSRFESYKGETFARNFILEGGIMSDYARNTSDGEMVTRTVTDVRGGFPSSKKKVNLTYGDPSIAADPTDDGYGVVPMPGIVDANIETKSAYGSLRSAKVNFVCHNLRQLEVLELLYMRPGYPVLMEWGWSPYIGNKGEIVNEFPSISKNDWFWDDSQVSQERIQNEVIRLKQITAGNYDGFIGFVTNFNYTARADGGFDCSTELISMGEVLDSLKVPSFGFSSMDESVFSNLSEEQKEKIIYQNSLGVLVQDLHNALSGQKDEEADKTIISGERTRILSAGPTGDFGGAVQRATLKQASDIRKIAATSLNTLTEVLGEEVAQQVFIPKNKLLKISGESELNSTQGYVRWDGLVELINKLVIPPNEKGEPPVALSTNLYRTDIDGTMIVDPLLYSKYDDIGDVYMDVSCDPKVCILPHQFNFFSDDDINLTLGQKISLAWLGLSFGNFKLVGEVLKAETKRPIRSNHPALEITSEIAERRIGGIYISVEKLKGVFESTFMNNRNATLGDFLKSLWDSINEVCPMHNFGLRTDYEHNNIIQVIDLPISTKDLEEINYNELFKFNVLSNDTIAREFKYDTQVPSSMKATIAINAQSGATADDIDSVTFAAFNRSIKSRIHSTSEKFSEKETTSYSNIQKTRREKERRLIELQEIISEYNEKFFNLIDANEDDIENLETKYGAIKSIIKEAQSLELYLEKSTSGYLKNQSVIPINVNIVLDGISGMVIGNVFRVDESRLPKAYRKSNIAFIVMGESQSISSGQDWTTTIRGQMIIFPTEEETSRKGLFRLTPQVTERVNFTNSRANEITSINEQFTAAESTTINIPAEGAVRDALGLPAQNVGSTGRDIDITNARNNLTGQGYKLINTTEIYELYQNPISDGTYNISYIITTGTEKGLIVNVGNYPDINPRTIFNIEGIIIATGRFE